MRERVESILARSAVVLILIGVAAGVALMRMVRRILLVPDRPPRSGQRHVVMVGTFYNAGWFESHVSPLIACTAVSRITAVCDAALAPMDKVVYACPPRWLVRCLGRTLARLLWLACVARQTSPDILMGYHIMPNALLCLLVARGWGLEAVYQMTGGPIQILGGGVGSENLLLRKQLKPSPLRQFLMIHLLRQFEWVVVRGRKAKAFLSRLGLADRTVVIPGSVQTSHFCPNGTKRVYDLISVGRLVKVKRMDRLLEIVAEIAARRPMIRVALVGDGPLLPDLRAMTAALGIEDNVDFVGRQEDVAHWLRQARVFLLTSENEGLSIAVMEAMAGGLPVIVPDTGDMRDVVTDGETGLFIDPCQPAAAAAAILGLLDDADRLQRLSTNARRTVVEHADVNAVARRWEASLRTLSGPCDAAPMSRHEERCRA